MSRELKALRTACALDCPDTSSLLVTVEDGRVTRLTDLGGGSTFQCNLAEVRKQ